MMWRTWSMVIVYSRREIRSQRETTREWHYRIFCEIQGHFVQKSVGFTRCCMDRVCHVTRGKDNLSLLPYYDPLRVSPIENSTVERLFCGLKKKKHCWGTCWGTIMCTRSGALSRPSLVAQLSIIRGKNCMKTLSAMEYSEIVLPNLFSSNILSIFEIVSSNLLYIF